ncbi:hypothetical protein [Flavihumibacter fluvii]|uniref:hypothetical protein n=1 Tax=Flavihumibacter fluvii TaxID=2838157 RepID=UPI001BDE2B51|nr:hypothetical protein [Flavihumibacter fluvii]ULQ53360.1 hypothetical protein KJS93_03390 [Flavihumibacter fluvii]
MSSSSGLDIQLIPHLQQYLIVSSKPKTKLLMHPLIILIISIFTSLLTYGQTVYKPRIVVLDPYQKKYDTALLAEIIKFESEAYTTPEEEREFLESLKNKEKNNQKIEKGEWEFRKKMDFGSMFTLSLDGMLTFMVFGQTDKGIVFPSHDTSNGEASNLKSIAKKHDVLWVVNPVSLHSYVKEGNKFTTVRLQVYDAKKNKIVLDKEYTGDKKNPGFELSCESGTLDCTVNNVIDPSLHDVLLTILGGYQH